MIRKTMFEGERIAYIEGISRFPIPDNAPPKYVTVDGLVTAVNERQEVPRSPDALSYVEDAFFEGSYAYHDF